MYAYVCNRRIVGINSDQTQLFDTAKNWALVLGSTLASNSWDMRIPRNVPGPDIDYLDGNSAETPLFEQCLTSNTSLEDQEFAIQGLLPLLEIRTCSEANNLHMERVLKHIFSILKV